MCLSGRVNMHCNRSQRHLWLRSGWCLTASSQYTCNYRCLLASLQQVHALNICRAIKLIGRQTRQTDRQIGRQAGRQAGRQTDRQEIMDRQMVCNAGSERWCAGCSCQGAGWLSYRGHPTSCPQKGVPLFGHIHHAQNGRQSNMQ